MLRNISKLLVMSTTASKKYSVSSLKRQANINHDKINFIENISNQPPKFGLIKIALNVSIFFLIGSCISKTVTNLLEQNNIFSHNQDEDGNDVDDDQDNDEY